MRVRIGLLACLAIVGLVVFGAIEPRFHHPFPSMVDDWSAIANAPEQLREVLRLGNPEEQRYRPGFIAWNALQWHTLGAPEAFAGPQLWGVLRVAVLVLGVTLLGLLLIESGLRRIAGLDPAWLLVLGVPLAVITAPSLAIDLARYGPQEPLLVGCMSLGAVLLVRTFDELLATLPVQPWVVAAAAGGVALWAFGVLQKETSACVLLLAPFLWPTVRRQRERWSGLDGGRRAAIGVVVGAMLLPFVPIVARTVELALADERVYEDAAAAKGFVDRLSDQLSRAGEVLHSPLPMILLAAAVVVLAIRTFRLGADWISTGLLVVALAFLLFAAEAGVVASRYYLPSIALGAFALARSVVPLGSAAVVATGVVLVAGGMWQAWEGHGWVEWWVDGERAQEILVREAAARAAGGCEVGVIGLNVELVKALPVLMPLADEPPRNCAAEERYLVVIDPGGPGTETPPDDPVLSACAPEAEPAWSSNVGKILRCTA
ncbi:MAG TPA: hypothetical protein VFO26_13650 [Gaiella sp.]|uniref:hypothetical protein n=1 Tax=Gaiella sp. TaxID=2663207 RepID=UPI002D7E379F|nr:hypothetical protein [Gaiella sp.]HET9288595.1 hypothetical protein [Gaiella sp.]